MFILFFFGGGGGGLGSPINDPLPITSPTQSIPVTNLNLCIPRAIEIGEHLNKIVEGGGESD